VVGVKFRKVHGAGNDFILFTGSSADLDKDWSDKARQLCARRTGIGADGLVVSALIDTGQPVMVKPAQGGSSVGMSLVRDEAALVPALDYAWATDPCPVLVEEYVTGLPVTVGLLELPGGLLAFPPLATEVHAGDFYDAAAKLDAEGQGTVSVTAADLPAHVLESLTRHAVALWEGLGCRGSARIDFVVTGAGQLYALEVNTTPGMSKDANFVTGAGLCGLSHADVVRAVLHEALTRFSYDVPLPTPVFTVGSTIVREPAS
jgi:D-alanine-D-alanine ligase